MDTNVYEFYLKSVGLKINHKEELYEILAINVIEDEEKETIPSFIAIQLDENGEDTMNQMFFTWNELTPQIQNNILTQLHLITI